MKKLLPILLLVLILAGGVFYFTQLFAGQRDTAGQTAPEQTKSQISASGSVASQNQAVLYFQTGGLLTALPFKVGDTVKKGEVVAALDSTDAQHSETAAEANYRSAQAALNLIMDNIHLSQYGNGGFANVGSSNETQTQKTQRQQAEEAVNAAYDNLQIAKQNLSQYSLVAPFDGILTQQSVTSTGINISALTSSSNTFTISDPAQAVFQVYVSPSDLGLLTVGSQSTVILDGANSKSPSSQTTFSGSVVKIYPDKTTTPSGDSAYKVDILIPNLLSIARFGQTGTALIATSGSASVTEVPTWTILNNHSIWVMEGGSPKLKTVSVGDSRGGETQILGGLSSKDIVITNPKSLIKKEYPIL